MKKTALNLQEWQQLVGKSIIAFGDIELVTYNCLTYLPSEHIFEVVSDLSFAKRIELISRIIESKDIPANLRDNFLELLAKAKEKAQVRNIIAHNPVQMSIYEHQKTGEILFQPEIAKIKKGNKVITIKDLQRFAEEVEELSVNLYSLMGQIFAKCR